MMPWLHKNMSNRHAASLIQGKPDGTFLVREHGTPAEEHMYGLSVMYNGNPTHHSVHAPPDDHRATVNGKAVGAIGLVDVVALLRTPQQTWPVPLTGHIAPEGGQEGPGNAGPALLEEVGGGTASSLAFVTRLDRERRRSMRPSFSEVGGMESVVVPRTDLFEAACDRDHGTAGGINELSRLHALSTANIRGAAQIQPTAEDTFDATVLQLAEHGNGLRVKSTRRANPIYRGSVYEESDKIGVTML